MIISIISDSVVSPLGMGSEANFASLQRGVSGIMNVDDKTLSDTPVYAAQIQERKCIDRFTWFESLAIHSVDYALQNSKQEIDLAQTVFILSTTKGNVELLASQKADDKNLLLHVTANKIASHIGIKKSYGVSNACASGVVAMMLGKQLLESGSFKHAIITGADVLSKFVVSGFQSLYALSDVQCKPFDVNRKGLNLGEAAATLILSSEHKSDYTILGSAATNDANHISGPSRTGEELGEAIKSALSAAKRPVDFISAHGTATLYNDEMEAKAFHHAGVSDVPVNSLKGYFGHTLGAAGLVEIGMSLKALQHQQLIASNGYEQHGVSLPLNVIKKSEKKTMNVFLKTASGFGGCNAAIVIGKSN